MKLTPSSTTRRSVAMAWSRLGGSPQMPGPVIRMAPNPRRLTVRSPPTSIVPAAAAVGCALTRYLLLVLPASLSRPPLACGRGGGTAASRITGERGAPADRRGWRGGPPGSVPLLLAVRGLRRGRRPAGHGYIGREVLRQGRRVRLPETAEELQDLDRFHVHGVDLLVLAHAEEHDRVFPGMCLMGELDQEVPALAQGHRAAQHLRADDAE